MKKFKTIKKSSQFQVVSQKGKFYKAKSFILKSCDSSLIKSNKITITQEPLFGITISRKVGKAVLRNLVRRRLKSILRTHINDSNLQYKIIAFYAKSRISNLSFAQLKKDVDKILKLV